MTDLIRPHSFNERSALEELELLADKIQRSRRQREQKVAEFDAFVRTFRHDRYAASIAATDRERRADDRSSVAGAAAHAGGAAVSGTSVAAPPMVQATGAPESVQIVAAFREPVAQAVAVSFVRPHAAYVGVGLAALAVVAVWALLWRSATAPVDPAAQQNVATAPAASTAPAVAAPSSAPAPVPLQAGPPRALNIEFVTIRPVWARVTVDGRRAMEREFQADQRIMFGADRAIAIRAGDAGAIRLIVDGKDLGVLGRDGQIFERSFAAAGR